MRHLFANVNVPGNEPDHTKADDNPRSSIHNFRLKGYSHIASQPPDVFGTGSWPVPPQGWQRARRFKPSPPPRRRPCVSTAPQKYTDQVGGNRPPTPDPQITETTGDRAY